MYLSELTFFAELHIYNGALLFLGVRVLVMVSMPFLT